MKITIEQDDDLALVIWCLACEAITLNEFRAWCLRVVRDIECPPEYFYDLIDFDGYAKDINKLIGFTPSWTPSRKQEAAILEIALARGIRPYESVNEKYCREALCDDKILRMWFSKMFPGISVDA